MSKVAALVSDHLDIWTAATERKNGAGRGGGKRMSLYGVERLRALIFDLAAAGRLEGNPNAAPEPLGKHVDLVMGQAPPGSACNTTGVGTAFVKTGEFGPFYPEVREWTTKPLKMAQAGDVLICVVGATIGKLNLAIDCAIGRSVAAVRPKSSLYTRYLYYALMPYTLRLRRDARGSAQGVIGKSELNAVTIRVPSLKEQQQIVAKVDELMALCDALEGESAAALAAHQTLVEALLATLVNSVDAVDLAANWSRLEAHFDTLFITEASVDALKQTVLELAVRGKLVGQDDSDRPAADLIASWQGAKQEKLEQGGDRRVKTAEAPAQPPFPLPLHWAIQSFENVFLFIDYRGNTPPKTEDGIPLITAKNIRMGYLNREPREFVSLATYKSWMTRGFPKVGDLFFTTEAPLGNICLNDIEEPFAIAQRAICLQPYGEANTRFLAIAIMSRSMQRVIDEVATGMTARGIKAGKLKTIALPIPPAAEQERIVAKVDELLALCEDIRAQIGKAGQTQMCLADAIVERVAA
ncbi:restriction endonuclease subunit S [Sphingomonas sp. Mn802worker]|uniref:restriction endonuclease subunit S n=1 Tax=Sphingomonas sp. Mn802worker TaxID=629773 RepID=UPI0003A9AE2D|nr:restriction endonuclease subunit S [Sphingomonas sp. Mn802worker]